MSFRERLYREFVAGQQWGDITLIGCGLLLQVVVYLITQDSVLSLLCGLLGVCSIFLSSQRKLASFVFGIAQIGIYLILSLQQKFYGELVENIFYLITSASGFVLWLRHYKHSEGGNQVESKHLSVKGWLLLGGAMAAGIAGGTTLLQRTNDPQPLLDTTSSVPAFAAQILMMLRYREQWVLWLVVDGIKTAQWVVAGNWSMAALFGFWCINCIYGFFKWR